MVKRTDSAGDWYVYHRSSAADAKRARLFLNLTDPVETNITTWNETAPTNTVFSVNDGSQVNASGGTYVAYLFAHDAGGFGLTGTDNVISCGSFTTNGSGNATVSLGYEPQWVTLKCASSAENWTTIDSMRGFNLTASRALQPNLSSGEISLGTTTPPNATGFSVSSFTASATYIYIAIRRGPMKVPTTGTSVFGLNARTGTGVIATVTGSAGVSDAVLVKNRGAAVASLFSSRLTGTRYLVTSTTDAEVAAGTAILQSNPWDVMDGVKVGPTSTITNASANTYINYLFDRAPGFFDQVCYTGTGVTGESQAHNLGVAPELMIVKRRNTTSTWSVGTQFTASNFTYVILNTTSAADIGATYNTGYGWFAQPTSTAFTLDTYSGTNASGSTYVAYLFATVAGVSKVGSYTGTGTTQTINCGFTGGARFVLIKRTDSTGDWYVWDSARGIIPSNDPYLLLNSAAAEVTGTDYVDTTSVGFEITSTAPAAINANGGSFIFLAIA
jgi:hypothetical protein